MNRNFYYFVIFLFVINCSFDTKTGIWTHSEKIISESKGNEENLFEKAEIYEKEFNVDLKIRLKSNSKKIAEKVKIKYFANRLIRKS